MQEDVFVLGVVPCFLGNPTPQPMRKPPYIAELNPPIYLPNINHCNGYFFHSSSLSPLRFLKGDRVIIVHRNERRRAPIPPVEVIHNIPDQCLELPPVRSLEINPGVSISRPYASPISGLGLGILVLDTIKEVRIHHCMSRGMKTVRMLRGEVSGKFVGGARGPGAMRPNAYVLAPFERVITCGNSASMSSLFPLPLNAVTKIANTPRYLLTWVLASLQCGRP
jgi:hypothetical protein